MEQYVLDNVTYVIHTYIISQPQGTYANTNMQALCDVCFVILSIHPNTCNVLHFASFLPSRNGLREVWSSLVQNLSKSGFEPVLSLVRMYCTLLENIECYAAFVFLFINISSFYLQCLENIFYVIHHFSSCWWPYNCKVIEIAFIIEWLISA